MEENRLYKKQRIVQITTGQVYSVDIVLSSFVS